jgi:dTDP-4-dehydrorhamnose 3,5-epimerase
MSRFAIADTPLAGLKLIERQSVGDARGYLSRLFCRDELYAAGWTKPIAQINHTHTAYKGTVRGMHFQRPPHAEMKLVSCLRGVVWDVAIDIRWGSPTFLQWYAVQLSADNCKAFLIPEGIAHGFQTLTDNVELLYCHSQAYVPQSESGLNPQDKQLSISWPLPVAELSKRDAEHPFIIKEFEGVRV